MSTGQQEYYKMKAQNLSLDRISKLPPNVTEIILSLVPIKEAVRTSILSTNWRYNWTGIPKVAFTDDFFPDESTDENQLPIIDQEPENPPSEINIMSRRLKLENAIYQFLLQHKGPIVDFTVSMKNMNPVDKRVDRAEIEQIFLLLSRKDSVKKLSLSRMYDLPLSVFKFPHLTDLYLYECSINRTPTSNGFGNLTTLYLEYVDIYKKALMHILSNNPLLKSVTILTEYATIVIDDSSTFVDLFECLPVIENLTFCAWDILSFSGGLDIQAPEFPEELPNQLVHLKYLGFERMCFLEQDCFRLLVLLIRGSPNLEKLKLQLVCEGDNCDWDQTFYSLVEYSDIWLEQLVELEIEGFRNRTMELEFVKLILTKSPLLKKLKLLINDKDEVSKMLSILAHYPRASPILEIIGDYVEGDNIV